LCDATDITNYVITTVITVKWWYSYKAYHTTVLVPSTMAGWIRMARGQ